MKILWLSFHLALLNILRQKRRSFVTIGAVAFGIAALILANGFISWMLLEFRELTVKSQLGHIQIVRPGFHAAGKADPFEFLLPDSSPELLINSEQQVKAIAPRLSFSGLISVGDSTLSFIGEGVDPQREEKFGNALLILSGQNLSDDNPLGIIIGAGFARNLGVNVGDQVILLSNTALGGINAVEVTVRGLFSTVSKNYDDTALRISIDTARKLLRVRGSHMWVVLLDDTAKTDIVLAKLRDKLPREEFETVPWYELADYYSKTITLFAKQTLGVKVIIALIILLSISNTMSMGVIERTGEIGTAMALGVKRTGIMSLFLCEGILIGCFGGLVGLMVGFSLASIVSSIGIPMPPPPSMARGYTGEILVTMNMAAESLMLAVGTTLVASIYPAWKASHMQIVDALRYNR